MSRQAVLSLLRQGGYVSGQAISQRLGLSRAAVWKAVDGLRKDGYEIQARTGLGYCLGQTPDLLTQGEIQSYLPQGLTIAHTLDALETVDSTNSYLKTLAVQGAQLAPHGTVVVSDCQSAGRGRMARSFHSPAGTGIYLSLLLRPQCAPQALMPLTAMAAVAICRAVEEICGLQAQIKWPNDIVVAQKKLCGILTELSIEGETGRVDYVVLGMGINVGQTAFPDELTACAVSLQQMGYTVSRPQLTALMLKHLDALSQSLQAPQTYLAPYRERCVNLGKALEIVRLDGTSQPVTGHAIDDTFALVVRHVDGTLETLQSGEVSIHGFYGKEPL
ncbi:biotin--[acetyl-CoA-carboxylase] ligase [Bengtsoniella intestinalis]|uniref:biotin--[acetyl-CoA-carboxylase] ligase n=1 Tax=Bengtsoniella intestinalis TaxID=3073143 RepID=UPI00391EE6C5